MTVEEVARSLGITKASPLMRMLRSPTVLSEGQAVACLGRSVHTRPAWPGASLQC